MPPKDPEDSKSDLQSVVFTMVLNVPILGLFGPIPNFRFANDRDVKAYPNTYNVSSGFNRPFLNNGKAGGYLI